jgi:hypothetical protein
VGGGGAPVLSICPSVRIWVLLLNQDEETFPPARQPSRCRQTNKHTHSLEEHKEKTPQSFWARDEIRRNGTGTQQPRVFLKKEQSSTNVRHIGVRLSFSFALCCSKARPGQAKPFTSLRSLSSEACPCVRDDSFFSWEPRTRPSRLAPFLFHAGNCLLVVVQARLQFLSLVFCSFVRCVYSNQVVVVVEPSSKGKATCTYHLRPCRKARKLP